MWSMVGSQDPVDVPTPMYIWAALSGLNGLWKERKDMKLGEYHIGETKAELEGKVQYRYEHISSYMGTPPSLSWINSHVAEKKKTDKLEGFGDVTELFQFHEKA